MKVKPTIVVLSMLLVFAAGAGSYYLSQPVPVETGAEKGAQGVATAANRNPGVVGVNRPEFKLSDTTGQLRDIKEWNGKVLALNFWATWCPPCIKEIPEFIEIQHKYESRGLQFIGIALQRPEEVTEFMREYGMNYPVLAGEMEVIAIAESYGNDIGALPYTVIIDRQGLIQFIQRGPLSAEKAESVIQSLL